MSRTPIPPLRATLFLAFALMAATPVRAQVGGADSLRLSLGRALALGLRENPQVLEAGYQRQASGAGLLAAYGRLLPQIALTGAAQRTEAGKFALFGSEFQSPATYATQYAWDISHSLLDGGRDWFRLREARADAERSVASYDLQSLRTSTDIKTQYLEARRQEALLEQARREVDRRQKHLDLARARLEAGEVTRSDELQARLSVNQGGVDVLRAAEAASEAELALRRLLGGALPPGPLDLVTDFQVFEPRFDVEELIERAARAHPAMRELEARREADTSSLWVARSSYLPSLSFSYTLFRSVVDTSKFRFSDFDARNYWTVQLNWSLFGGFSRYSETSQANAALQSTRAEIDHQRLTIEEDVQNALSRLRTAFATNQANRVAVELAQEDLRLGEGRYQVGTGSFVDLQDARVRAAQAETDLIGSTYDFYQALVDLERATGLNLFPDEALQ